MLATIACISVTAVPSVRFLNLGSAGATFVPYRCWDGSVNWDKVFRDDYEEMIQWGAIKRPSLVNSWYDAFRLAKKYVALGDQHNASIRLAQAVVILEEEALKER